jgi:AbrB family looped-hinge helix DNA binding protein
VGILNNFFLGFLAVQAMVGESRREVLGTSSITRKAQVTIPKRVRDRFKIKEGDLVMFIEMNDRLYIAKSTEV